MKYFVLRKDRDRTLVRVTKIPDAVEDSWELVEGVSRADGWPDEVVLDYTADRPEGMVLGDYVNNAHAWLIVSARFKALLENADAGRLEYLPVQMRNHKGAIVDEAYWIANPVPLIPVVDRDASDFDFDEDEPDEIDFDDIESLVLRSEVQEDGPAVIRALEDPYELLIREDVVEGIRAEGLTGMDLIPTDDFSG